MLWQSSVFQGQCRYWAQSWQRAPRSVTGLGSWRIHWTSSLSRCSIHWWSTKSCGVRLSKNNDGKQLLLTYLPRQVRNVLLIGEFGNNRRILWSEFQNSFDWKVFVLRDVYVLHVACFDCLFLSRQYVANEVHVDWGETRQIKTRIHSEKTKMQKVRVRKFDLLEYLFLPAVLCR